MTHSFCGMNGHWEEARHIYARDSRLVADTVHISTTLRMFSFIS